MINVPRTPATSASALIYGSGAENSGRSITLQFATATGGYTSANTAADDFTYLTLQTCQSPRFDRTTLPAGVSPRAIATADFNGDGRSDLVVANNGVSTAVGSENISVRLGNGNGTFGPLVNFASPGNPRHVVVADFNEDGRSDVAVANQTTNDISIFIGNGAGGFGTATKVPVAAGPLFIATGDFDSDGHTDLAITHDVGNSNNIVILLGTGTGSFVERTRLSLPSGIYPFSLAIADFNEDGRPDIVAGHAFNGSVSIFRGDGTGLFPTVVEYATTASPRSGTRVAVGDFNGDGHRDSPCHTDRALSGSSSVQALALLARGPSTPSAMAAAINPSSSMTSMSMASAISCCSITDSSAR